MMSLSQINYMNSRAARRSRAQGLLPVSLSLTALEGAGSLRELAERGVKVPHIGNRRPRGFRPVGEPLFIDLSGFGSSDEPALTLEQTWRAMVDATREHGTLCWALVEVGQFQGYLQAFKTT